MKRKISKKLSRLSPKKINKMEFSKLFEDTESSRKISPKIKKTK